jgi:lysophospholipase L1-like esterase
MIIFGDSIGVGVAMALTLGLHIPCDNLARVGWGLTRGMDRIHELSHIASGETVLISVGSNDTHDSGYEGRLIMLREEIGPAVNVIWLLPTKCGKGFPWLRLIKADIQSVSERNGDKVIDPAPCYKRAGDGIHFTPEGYRQLAEELQ